MFFVKKGPVWDTLRRLEQRLHEEKIDYVVIGGLALNAYNYPRQTVDVDVVLRPDDFERFKSAFQGSVYKKAKRLPRRYVDPLSEVSVDVLITGELSGRTSKNKTIRFPDPSEAEMHGDLRTVSLDRAKAGDLAL